MKPGRAAGSITARVAPLLALFICAVFLGFMHGRASAQERVVAGNAGSYAIPTARTHVDRRVDAIPELSLQTLSPAKVVDPLRAEVTKRVAAVKRPLFFLWSLVQLVTGFWLWRSGTAAAWRDGLRRKISNRIALRAAYVACVTLTISLSALPFDAINYRTLVDVGVTRQNLWSWLWDLSLAMGLQILGAVFFIVIILELVDRTRLWYLWSTAVVIVSSAAILIADPLVVEPLFHTLTPLARQSELGVRLTAVEQHAGLGLIPIFISDLSRTTEVGNANVSGFGPTRRVTIGDTLLRTATPREVAFVMAHELGHQRHHDTIRLTLLSDLLVLLAGALGIIVSERISMRRDDDELSRLPLVATLVGVFAMVLLPIGNAYSRHVEHMADSFALQVTHDGTAGARMFVRFADEGFAPVCPPRAVHIYFYDHPPLGSRITYVTGRPDPCP